MASLARSILIVDNYDSFTYIIREYLGQRIGFDRIEVIKNDRLATAEVMKYGALIISPGPGLPSESGKLVDLLKVAIEKKPVLGICLGHQAIAEIAGAELVNLGDVRHGHQLEVNWIKDCGMAPSEKSTKVGLYHSWVIKRKGLPNTIHVLAESDTGHIMAIQYKDRPVFGVQFHPESVLTSKGKEILFRFLAIAGIS